jgi:hypothetical protein
MPWEHAAEARAALNSIVTDPEHGVQVLSSPKTMSNLLKDLLPDAPREKSVLVAAAEAGLADTLRDHVSQGMDPSTAIQLTASSFSASSPLTPEACSWVTSEIAAAMGISSPAELDSSGRTSGSAGQMSSGGSAASRSAAGYSSEAPTRDYARPPGQRVDSASAQGSGQAAPGSFEWGRSSGPESNQRALRPAAGFGPGPEPGFAASTGQVHATGQMDPHSSPSASQDFPQVGGPGFAQAVGPGFARAGSHNAGQPGSLGFPQSSNPGHGQPQIQSNPQNYAPGPVAGYQQPVGHQQPAGYPQPGPQSGVPAWPGATAYTGQKTNSLAVAALVCGIVQFFGFWLLGTVPAIVLGHMARNQIRQRNEQGAGLALAGLILGYVGIALTVIVVIIIIIAAVHSARSSSY